MHPSPRVPHQRLRRPVGQPAAVRVAEYGDIRAGLRCCAQNLHGVGRIAAVAVEEVLGVEEDAPALGAQMGHGVADHREVLLERRAEGELDVPLVALRHEGHDGRTRVAQRGHLGVIGGLHTGTAGCAERG